MAKIVVFTAVLASPSADRHARLEALNWVVHLLGDIHQPMHAEDDNHDRGGNTVKLTYFGSLTNLHAVWDGAMSDLAKAMRYALRHWDGLILYLDDGRLEMDTNVVERAIRPVTITRKNSLFAGSDAGARRWAIANTLIQSCKLNGVAPLAYLSDVLQRIISGRTKNHELHALLPWHWHPPATLAAT